MIMSKDKRPTKSAQSPDGSDHDHTNQRPEGSQVSRRALIGSAAVGAAIGTLATAGLPGSTLTSAAQAGRDDDHRDWDRHNSHNRRIILKGGIVLTMDPQRGDFARADVLIEGSKIRAIGSNLGRD